MITLFPQMVQSVACGVTGRGIEQSLVNVQCYNPRDFADNLYQSVDDRPYGGGPGMVMMPQILKRTLDKVLEDAPSRPKVVYLSPQGKPLDQAKVQDLVNGPPLVLIAGRYEGIDERFIERYVDEEVSIGDYVLSGGELAAMVVIDAMARLVPGVLGHGASALQDSFSDGLLDYPHYTRPLEFEGLKVPDVLQSGHHKNIERWRHKQALGRTWLRRRDVMRPLNQDERVLLEEFMSEHELAQKL